MLDSLTAACTNVLGPTFAEGRQPVVRHERTTGGSSFYRLYRTSDGGHVAIAGQEPKFVEALLNAVRRPDLVALVVRGPGPHQAPVAELLEREFARRTLAECEQWLAPLDVCFGSVRSLPEAFADPNLVGARHAAARRGWPAAHRLADPLPARARSNPRYARRRWARMPSTRELPPFIPSARKRHVAYRRSWIGPALSGKLRSPATKSSTSATSTNTGPGGPSPRPTTSGSRC